MIDMTQYDRIPLEALRRAARELTDAVETLHQAERDARKVLRVHYGLTVASRAYRRSKPGSGVGKVKAAIRQGEAKRRDAERDLDAIRKRIVELEAE